MSKTAKQIIASNTKHFMERGPGLSYGYDTYCAGRDRANRKVLRGGLGGMGVGQMWEDENESSAELPGFADAPEEKFVPEPIIEREPELECDEPDFPESRRLRARGPSNPHDD